jgi:hypothetical protein
MVNAEVADNGIECIVVERQGLGVTNPKVDVRVQILRLCDHTLDEIDSDYFSADFTGRI